MLAWNLERSPLGRPNVNGTSPVLVTIFKPSPLHFSMVFSRMRKCASTMKLVI